MVPAEGATREQIGLLMAGERASAGSRRRTAERRAAGSALRNAIH